MVDGAASPNCAAPLRILHCHSTFALGGKEARAARLMNAFGPHARHVVLSAVPDQLGARDALLPTLDVEFPGDACAPPLHGKPAQGRYRALARYFTQFDLILTYNWGSMDAVMARRFFAPFMPLPPLIHHEDGFNADESEKLNWKRNAFRRLALPTAHALVVPSHRLADIARQVWGVDGALHRISNGIATARYGGPPTPGMLAGLAMGDGPFLRDGDVCIGTVAGLRAVKDLPLLVAALAQTPPNIRLIIVGDGPERAHIAATAAALGVADRVLLPGFVADPAQVIGHFDIMALSSLSEQQPIAVMEGMAAGLPILSPAVGDVAAMVAAENAPFIVPRTADALAAAMRALAADAGLRAAVGTANRARAGAEFDESAMLNRYAALYAGAMGVPPSRLLDAPGNGGHG
ncbi:MAG: glycosyltransferase [Sphingopyxis sp.]